MTVENDHILLVIAGPTAVGKTETAIRIASSLHTGIISADSRQFYREMNIGTAKPDERQLSEAPHYFIGHLSVHDNYNISRFEQDAIALLGHLFLEHRVVLMCGGSGMYIDAVCNGIDALPDADPTIRLQLRNGYEKYGIQYLRNRLLDLDPDYYSEVDTGNPQRLIRALEVCMATGMPYSAQRTRNRAERNFMTLFIGLMTDRKVLYERINARVDRMMEQGLESEARELFPFRHMNSLQTVGYRELFDYFEGKITREEAIEKIRTNTRRYAKRQLTWFRRNPELMWFDPTEENTDQRIIDLIQKK